MRKHDLFFKHLILVVALLLFFSSISFADSAPPMRPQVQLNLTKNGQPYLLDANVTYLCSVRPTSANPASTSQTQNSALDRMTLLCHSDGSCDNFVKYDYMGPTWFDYGSPCFYSKGRFMVEAEERNITSGEVSLERGAIYGFVFDIGTGNLTASATNPPPGPKPGVDYSSFCYPSLILFAVIFLGVILRS